MAVFERFEQLDEEAFFVAFVSEHFGTAWAEVTDLVRCSPVIDDPRLKLAFDAYSLAINQFKQLLHSKNPDHYKRAAAFLHSLYTAEIISTVNVDEDHVQELEGNSIHGLSHGDCQHRLKVMRFYVDHCNQLMAFDLAFRCCQAYEEKKKTYDANYLESMCHYLKGNKNLTVDSLYMILKSYMADGVKSAVAQANVAAASR